VSGPFVAATLPRHLPDSGDGRHGIDDGIDQARSLGGRESLDAHQDNGRAVLPLPGVGQTPPASSPT